MDDRRTTNDIKIIDLG